MNNKKQTVGFLNMEKSKRATLINCSSIGVDIGLKNEGEDLYAENFQSINKNLASVSSESILHKNVWYHKWWLEYLVFPLVVLVVGAFIVFILRLNN